MAAGFLLMKRKEQGKRHDCRWPDMRQHRAAKAEIRGVERGVSGSSIGKDHPYIWGYGREPSINRRRMLGEGAHMLQVSTDPHIIVLRIGKRKMRGHLTSRASEQHAHRVQGLPSMLVTGVRIGLLKQRPELRL